MCVQLHIKLLLYTIQSIFCVMLKYIFFLPQAVKEARAVCVGLSTFFSSAPFLCVLASYWRLVFVSWFPIGPEQSEGLLVFFLQNSSFTIVSSTGKDFLDQNRDQVGNTVTVALVAWSNST